MSPYDQPEIDALIAAALHEDLHFTGDRTVKALVPPGSRLRAQITAKASGVICGLPLFARIFTALEGAVSVGACARDGAVVHQGEIVFEAVGDAATLLIAERTGLNLVQRLSATASLTRRFVDAVAGTKAGIFDTRKTTPGLRLLQKHAVLAGGGRNHRMGLHDQVLIKENHIALWIQGGGPAGVCAAAAATAAARVAVGPEAIVECEIERLEDLAPVITAGADIVLCDNLPAERLREAVVIRAATASPRPKVDLEASGGITLATVRGFAETGIERISVGALTHSAGCLDLSLRCALV